MAKLLAALKSGHTVGQSRAQAGVGPKLWANLRRDWDKVPAILDANDPHGARVDLGLIERYVTYNKGQGGRPKGARDAQGARTDKRREQEGVTVGTLLDHPWFPDE